MRRFYYFIPMIVIILAVILTRDQFGRDVIPANDDLTGFIKVYSPQPTQKITSPLKVSGEARGNWYFEASFPIIIVDWDGRIIGEGHAQAVGDWMTAEFVPFEGTVEFDKPLNIVEGTYNERGAVIFKKDNPSGLPEHDAAVEIPVVFVK